MIHFLVMGSLLGFSAGIAPGPLLTLVVSETLAHDVRSGISRNCCLTPSISCWFFVKGFISGGMHL